MGWARWAVGRWSEFPVDQTPRPVVLVGSRVHVEAGFATGEAKMAFLEGRWDEAVEVPAPVLDELRGQGSGVRSGGASLVVTSVELAASEFVTDRGRRRLPAWRLTVQDALGPIWVLDPEIVDWRPSEGAGGDRPTLPLQRLQPRPRARVRDPGSARGRGAPRRAVAVVREAPARAPRARAAAEPLTATGTCAGVQDPRTPEQTETEEALSSLRQTIRDGRERWLEVEAADGAVLIDLGQVVYLRVESDEHRVGF